MNTGEISDLVELEERSDDEKQKLVPNLPNSITYYIWVLRWIHKQQDKRKIKVKIDYSDNGGEA